MKIAFYCPGAAQLFNPSVMRAFGGAEVRALTLAKRLSEIGDFDVSLFVSDAGIPLPKKDADLQVATIADPHERRRARFRQYVESTKSFPYLKLQGWSTGLLLDLTALFSTRMLRGRRDPWRQPLAAPFGRQVPDVVCCFGVSNDSYRVIQYCHDHQVRSVLFIASDADLSENYTPDSKQVGSYGDRGDVCYDAIQLASQIVVQTESQRTSLEKRFGRSSTVIRNPLRVDDVDSPKQTGEFALWIGRTDDVKNPACCLSLAGKCPDIPFHLVLNNTDSEMFHRMVSLASSNVTIQERANRNEVAQLFSQSQVLVNTSAFEGFPNTFLEAAKYSVPIFSLNVDPDGFIERTGAGMVAQGDLDRLATELRRVWSDTPRLRQMGQAARDYVVENHDLDKIIEQLAAILEGVCAGKKVS